MDPHVDRRKFLWTAGTGIASGAVIAVATSGKAAEQEPLLPPLAAGAQGEPATQAAAQPVCCDPAKKLVFACSGAADVGEIADRAARKLTADGVGKMFCLAGVGGRVGMIMENTGAAEVILAIDGCPLHCARNTLEKAGFTKFAHLCLSDLGMAKGKTSPTAESIAQVADRGKELLQK